MRLSKNWCWAGFSEICERISVGHVGPTSQYFSDDKDSVPLVRSQDVRPGMLRLGNALHITKTFHSRLKKSQLQGGEILIVRVGANRSDTCMVPKDVTDINCANIIFARPFFNGLFFVYFLNSDFGRKLLLSVSTGSAQEVINTQSVAKLPIPIPPYEIQMKISAILSAYDDLIENNNRRITILEKMVEGFYREWFVRLRFPGHEKIKIVKGVPEGWEVVSAGKYLKLVKGRSYSSEEIADYNATENHRFFITLKNFKRGGGFRQDGKKYYCGKYNENQLVTGGSLVIAVTDMTQDRAVIGRIARIPFGMPESIISCDVVKIEPLNISDLFLYALLRFSSYSESLKEFANGANVLHLKPELASIQKIIVPSKPLRDSFDNKFRPLIKAMDSINNTLELLTASRDHLLSRLISGKIDVEKMDIEFPPSMKEEVAVHA